MLASGSGSRQNYMNSAACTASDSAANSGEPRTLAGEPRRGQARRIGRQHHVGRVTFGRARTQERNDVAETGRLGRVNAHARIRGDAGMAGTQLDQLAAAATS